MRGTWYIFPLPPARFLKRWRHGSPHTWATGQHILLPFIVHYGVIFLILDAKLILLFVHSCTLSHISTPFVCTEDMTLTLVAKHALNNPSHSTPSSTRLQNHDHHTNPPTKSTRKKRQQRTKGYSQTPKPPVHHQPPRTPPYPYITTQSSLQNVAPLYTTKISNIQPINPLIGKNIPFQPST
jgi:hypothetical protein